MEIDSVDFLFQLAVILFSAKMLGILMRKLGLPQVLGFILAGLLIGPAIWGMIPGVGENWIFPLRENDMLSAFAEVGVIFVMFTAGLETDLKEMKNSGVISFLVALGGVLVPLGAGFGIGVAFLGTENLLSCLFVGVIMTATSVGITVETLRELGKLKGKVGTIILSAAIIDDVKSYYTESMRILDTDIRNDLFYRCGKIFTKVKDSVPTKYGAGASVRNSLIADGCEINGRVENSILFRGVVVEEGAYISNSIVMENGRIMKYSELRYTITDKDVTVTEDKTISGSENYPVVIVKNKTV